MRVDHYNIDVDRLSDGRLEQYRWQASCGAQRALGDTVADAVQRLMTLMAGLRNERTPRGELHVD